MRFTNTFLSAVSIHINISFDSVVDHICSRSDRFLSHLILEISPTSCYKVINSHRKSQYLRSRARFRCNNLHRIHTKRHMLSCVHINERVGLPDEILANPMNTSKQCTLWENFWESEMQHMQHGYVVVAHFTFICGAFNDYKLCIEKCNKVL